MPSPGSHHHAVVGAFPCCIRPSCCAWSTVSQRLSCAPPLPISQAKRSGTPPLCHRKPIMTPRGTPPPRLPPVRPPPPQGLVPLTAGPTARRLPPRDRGARAGQEDADDHSHLSPASPTSGICLSAPVDTRTGTHAS